jgi:signal transduction histidine kinase/ligand-binding sensor domain-containing protein
MKSFYENIFQLVLIAASLGCSFGQDIQFQQITVKNGLSNSYVNCLLQDKVGFIWIGTDDGLNRFDGYDIKVYRKIAGDSTSLSDNIIWSLFEDQNGYLWIGTKNGKLSKYDPYKDSFSNWSLDSSGTGKYNITFITEDNKKNIWIGTYKNGLYRFNPKQNKFENLTNDLNDSNVLSSSFVTCILQDDFSNIWVSTYNGLNKINPGDSKNPFTRVNVDSNELPIWYLGKSSIFKDTIWIGKLDGLFKFNPTTEESSQINLPQSSGLQFSNSVSSIAEESFLEENILWIGTYGGLVRYNLTTGDSKRFTHNKSNPFGILSNQINDIIIDRSGVVWIAADNGLNFYSPQRSKFNFPISNNLISLESSEIKNGNIRAITQTKDGSLWFGTETGLFNIETKNQNNTLNKIPGLQSLNTWCLYPGNSDNLWIGTYGQGVKELNLKSKTIKPWKVENPQFNPSPYYYVKSLLQDNEGMLWIGFWGGGLARLNPLSNEINYWRQEPDQSESLSYNDIWAIYQDRKGRIWIGTNGGGLDLFNDSRQNSFYHWTANSKVGTSLSNNNIYTIVEAFHLNNNNEQTILWIGTANGLNKFTIQNESNSDNNFVINVNNKSYTIEDGLPDNAIEIIREDENGNLWIGTSSSITFFDLSKETFKNFSSADGLSGGAFNSCASFKTSDGIILFGSTSGVNFFDPKRISQSKFSPPIVITDFQLFNQSGDLKNDYLLEQSVFHSKEITLAYSQNDFSFQFASLDYNAPGNNQYAYKLEGLDKEWINCGTRRFVTYTNLDPGDYVFHVKATNSDGVWNEVGTKLSIIINPPFWRTWWAYSLYVIVFFSVLASIRLAEIKRRKRKEEERLRRVREAAQLREAKLKAITIEQEKELEKQKIRNRIAQDLHDEVGSNLSSISLMSELIQKDGKIDQGGFEKIQRIQKVAKGSSQAMRDIVWLTNPSSDNIKDLISKMNEVANDMLGNIKWQFDFPQNISDIKLIPEVKRNIFFIYKESLNNILKHANAQKVNVDMKVIDKKMWLTIKDDGDGFDISKSFSGNGLKNLRSRANEIKGDLSVESSLNNGTTINLLVNITQLRD